MLNLVFVSLVGLVQPAAETPRLCMADPPGQASGTRVSQLEWLAGTWIGRSAARTVEERWTPPTGGSMLAVARTLRNDRLVAFEFLCIVERRDGIIYTAMPNGRQPATDFTLTKLEGRSVTFENPAHDFPQKIRYTLLDDGTLEAVISTTDDRKPQVFRFQRE